MSAWSRKLFGGMKKAEEVSLEAFEWPSVVKPSAVLVPQFVRDQRALAQVKSRTVMTVSGVGVVAAAAMVFAYTLTSHSASELELAQQQRALAEQQIAALAPVAEYYDGITLRNARTSALMAHDVVHADVFAAITRALPASAELTGYATAFGAPCVTPDPFEEKAVVGCVDMTLSGAPGDAQRVLNALSESADPESKPLIVDAFVLDQTIAEGVSKFRLSVNMTEHAYSSKYVNEKALAEQQEIEAAKQAAAAAAAAAAQAAAVPTPQNQTGGAQ